MIWYCDASALVKRYVLEEGSRWFRRQVDNHTVLISHITVVEVHAALATRHRLGTVSLFSFFQARNNFNDHIKRRLYRVLPFTESIVSVALRCFPIIHYAHTTQLS